MSKRIFIDTGAFYARYVAKDDHHRAAIAAWDKVRRDRIKCLTSNFVLSEFITLVAYRFGTPSALKAGREVYASQAIEVECVTADLEHSGLNWMERFSDQAFSMTDAVSFACMVKQKISVAFTFDHHFDVAGFSRFS